MPPGGREREGRAIRRHCVCRPGHRKGLNLARAKPVQGSV